jgi:quaternary ammonium compound-resistance protein SugE
MSWVLLLVAGAFEVAWASILPATEGLTRPAPTAAFVGLLTASMLALSKAAESIPVGTAYSVWVGVGAVGAGIVGIVIHGDPATPARVGFLVLLVAAIVGLKATGGH